MNRLTAKCLGVLLLGLLPWAIQARIEAPDHVIYGSVTIFGTPAAPGMLVSARTVADDRLIASYPLGRFPRLGSQYALRFPMDTVNPRLPGRARPGDPIRIFIGSQLAAETVVGAEGVAVRLDLDPQNMGTGPSIRVDDVAAFEGNSGTTPFVFPLFVPSTGSDWTSPAVVHWATEDDSAVGGPGCGEGVDYISASGSVSVEPAAVDPETQVGTITVQVCGDTQIEADETFLIRISQCDFCVPVEPTASGTIIDDDDVPELRIADIYVSKPASATAPAVFVASLSRNSVHPASFSFQTVDGSALAGVHYVATSGQVEFAAGEVEQSLSIELLPHPEVEPERTFRLQLADPVGLEFEREQAFGFIIDPRFEPALTPDGDDVGGDGGVPGLLNPSAIALAPDGVDAYVVSESGDAVLHFQRDPLDGVLSLAGTYASGAAGLEDARLDAPRDLLLSQDGAHLYVAARQDGAVNVFARNPGDGTLALTQVVFQGQSAGASTVAGLEGVMALTLSPDGEHLYAAGADANGVAVFARDGGSGALQYVQAILNGLGGVAFLERPTALAVAGDGAQVYVTARNANALHVFAREGDDSSEQFGRLTPQAVYRNGQQGVQGLSGVHAVALSGDGGHLYVASEGSNSVVWFERDGSSGSLTWRQRWQKGPGIPGLGGPLALMLSHDQRYLLVPGFADNSLSIFDRSGDGSLDLRQTLLSSQEELGNMIGPMALDVSGDSRFAYVVANVGNAIVRLRIRLLDPIFRDGFEAQQAP